MALVIDLQANYSMKQLDEALQDLPDYVQAHVEHLERMRRDFVANVSHELRTPLTVIRGYLEMLNEQLDQVPQHWHKIFMQMHQHSLRMEHLIEDLLLLSRLENSEQVDEQHEQVTVDDLLAVIYHDAIDLSADKHHKIELISDKTLTLIGDADELKSLFSNLIFNAVKYTPANGEITIKWFKQDNFPTFQVIDNGIGIASKHIPRLTERFYRVDKARSRDSGGTGLGLAIAKHVLLRHNAELIVDSQLGQGSQFTCIFS